MHIRTSLFLVALLCTGGAQQALATEYNVGIDTSKVQGTAGALVFDVASNASVANIVTILNFTHDGTTGLVETQGGPVRGDIVPQLNPAPVTTIADASFFNELLVPFTSFGTSISFTIIITENAPVLPGEFPDEFSLFLLDGGGLPLFPTSDPLGADALFVVCVDGTSTGLLQVFDPTTLTPPDALQVMVPIQLILIANFTNGNDDSLNSRVYLWNPSQSDGSVTVRVFTLPVGGGVAEELTTEPLALGILAARSALNVKLAEDILIPLGIPTPYTTDGGNLTLEFTIEAADVRGSAQVFSSSFAFGTYPLQEIPSTSSGSPTVLVANFMNGNNTVFNSRVYLWNPSANAGDVTVRVFTLPLTGGVAQELTATALSLGSLEAKSALNIKLAEDILAPLGITLPYSTDDGDLTLEFTIAAADVVGSAQVFSSSFASGTNSSFGFGVYPLQQIPLNSSTAQELTATPLSLGSLGAKSARNVKLAEDILTPLGITPPYTIDGGNLTLEFTIQAANVVGSAQVFSSSFAFGTYPLAVIQ